MGLSINPFNTSASVPANTTTDAQATATKQVIQNQNTLRFGVTQASVVVDLKGQVVSSFNA